MLRSADLKIGRSAKARKPPNGARTTLAGPGNKSRESPPRLNEGPKGAACGHPHGGSRFPRDPRKSRGDSACKPGSVESNHSSGTRVTAGLERPTRKRARIALRTPPLPKKWPAPRLPYLALLQVGFAVPPSVATGAVRSYRTLSPLPAFTCDREDLGGLLSVALSVGSRPPGVTWHLIRRSPDFPPPPPKREQRLPSRLPAPR
jgi:hypothetical protein